MIFSDQHQTSKVYQQKIEHFSKNHTVITFDDPTTGKSTHKVMNPDERDADYWGFWADLTCHQLIELEIDHCFALGVGDGTLEGLHFACEQADHRIKVRRLVLDSFLADTDTRTLHRWLDVGEHFYVRYEKSLIGQHGEDWRAVVNHDTEFLRNLAD